jgi:hypothetical protein
MKIGRKKERKKENSICPFKKMEKIGNLTADK